jgi:hypothetical protein
MLISILYMFQATPCSSSGESIVSIQSLVYVTLRKWPSGTLTGPDLYTRRSPTQSDILVYQMLYWYNWFSWWWARGCSKHVQNWNKYIRKKNCASSWSFTRIIRFSCRPNLEISCCNSVNSFNLPFFYVKYCGLQAKYTQITSNFTYCFQGVTNMAFLRHGNSKEQVCLRTRGITLPRRGSSRKTAKIRLHSEIHNLLQIKLLRCSDQRSGAVWDMKHAGGELKINIKLYWEDVKERQYFRDPDLAGNTE